MRSALFDVVQIQGENAACQLHHALANRQLAAGLDRRPKATAGAGAKNALAR
jgi:hypothetical protein